jgi:ADP-ribosylglycohydrolase
MTEYSLSESEMAYLRGRGLLPDPWSGEAPWPAAAPTHPDTLRARYRGCLIGGAIGDALGRPGEGKSPARIQQQYGELRDFHAWRGWTSGPKGTITDDTQLTMEVARTYLATGCLDPSDFAMRVGTWLDIGRGKGHTCTEAALLIRAGHPWFETGRESAGNGSAMRASPVGLARLHSLDLLRQEAMLSCVVTHADKLAVASTVAMAFSVAYLVRVSAGALALEHFAGALVASLDGVHDAAYLERRQDPPPQRVRLSERITDVASWLDRSWQEVTAYTWTGAYVLESLPAAIWFFLRYSDDPEECLVRAASVGHDSDTIAAMAGNMIGAYHGLEALPERWRSDLEYYDELIDMADGLLELAGDA